MIHRPVNKILAELNDALAALHIPLGGAKPEEVVEFVGSRLRHRRVELGLSQAQMGQAIGRSYAQISKYELGKDQMTTAMLCRVARALGVSVGWLFGEEPITDDRD